MNNFHAFKKQKFMMKFWLVRIHCGLVSCLVTVLRRGAVTIATNYERSFEQVFFFWGGLFLFLFLFCFVFFFI